MKLKVVFANGYELNMVKEAGYVFYKLTNTKRPTCFIVGNSYKFNTENILTHPYPLESYRYKDSVEKIMGARYTLPKETNDSVVFLDCHGFRNWLTYFHNIDVGDIDDIFV